MRRRIWDLVLFTFVYIFDLGFGREVGSSSRLFSYLEFVPQHEINTNGVRRRIWDLVLFTFVYIFDLGFGREVGSSSRLFSYLEFVPQHEINTNGFHITCRINVGFYFSKI